MKGDRERMVKRRKVRYTTLDTAADTQVMSIVNFFAIEIILSRARVILCDVHPPVQSDLKLFLQLDHHPQLNREEADLMLAIALSLADTGGSGSNAATWGSESNADTRESDSKPKEALTMSRACQSLTCFGKSVPPGSRLVTDTAVGSNRDEKASAVKSSPLEKVENLGGGATEMRGGVDLLEGELQLDWKLEQHLCELGILGSIEGSFI